MEVVKTFERFTDRARRVVILSQEVSRKHGHSYIGTRHLFAGLIEEDEGVAAVVLKELGYTVDAADLILTDYESPKEDVSPGHIPFSIAAKKVIEFSLREALQLGHNYIGTEHLLLGLLRQERNFSSEDDIFTEQQAFEIRQAVIKKLSDYAGVEQTTTAEKLEKKSKEIDERFNVSIIQSTWGRLSRLHRLQVLTEMIESSDPEDRAWIRRFLEDEYDKNGDAA